jgi:hypothetical protein
MANGWQDLDSIVRALGGAAVAASIAGASEVYEEVKDRVKQDAPVGKNERTVHFANPRIPGGRRRTGGRTRDTVSLAYPDIDIIPAGDKILMNIKADVVMAPQGIYQNDPGKIVTTRPKPPLKRLGWIVSGNRGIWPLSAVTRAGGGHRGWLDRALLVRTFPNARMEGAWAAQFTSGGIIRPRAARILDRPFVATASTGSWFGSKQSRNKVKDLALRRQWQAASRRAAGQWRRAYQVAIRRFG